MTYESELGLLQSAYKKCRVQTLRLDPDAPLDKRIDMGLGQLVGDHSYYKRSFRECVPPMEKSTIYRYEDAYGCHYIYFILAQSNEILLIGPYLSKKWEYADVLEIAEKHMLSPKIAAKLEDYYQAVPVISEGCQLFAMLDAFAERMWGGAERFSLEMVEAESFYDNVLSVAERKELTRLKDDLWNMQIMESRYAYENELMQAVSLGHIHKAEMILSTLGEQSFEKRLSDPLRNIKNYCIIMNTLLRKAAEQGGVHPLYLDRSSSAFARKIEQLDAAAGTVELMQDMTRSYCRLVKKYALQNYSSPVQKCVVCIDTDLTQDLSLGRLSKLQNISPAYLSALFRKETGQTLTDYVNLKRVEYAKKLLRQTDLQVQTVAQHCGILDIHYFSRVFKKYTTQSPKEYRNSCRK